MLIVGKSHGNSQGNACRLLHAGTAAQVLHQWLSQAPFLLSGHTVLWTHSPLQGMQLLWPASRSILCMRRLVTCSNRRLAMVYKEQMYTPYVSDF